MNYVNHYEIEVKINNQWTYLTAVWPKYEWRIVRPWYYLGLVTVPRIVDPVNPPLVARLEAIVAAGEFAYTVKPHTPARVWQVVRGGWRGRCLKKHLTWETI